MALSERQREASRKYRAKVAADPALRAERNAYLRDYASRRYKQRREAALTYLGGRCADCGTDSLPLEFDHRNPAEKSFRVTAGFNLSWEKLVIELDKCDLRCTPCHYFRTGFQRIESIDVLSILSGV